MEILFKIAKNRYFYALVWTMALGKRVMFSNYRRKEMILDL